MNIIHTSDWHLGKTLYGKKRYDEFERFLSWLIQLLHEKQTDILLMAGDVFDTHTPSNRAQALYYQFLCDVAKSPCRHVVIIGGNHDSPSFLNAPKNILKSLNIHVIGNKTVNLEDEIVLLKNPQNNKLEAVICAVPYLRDKDIRQAQAGENWTDKERKLQEGIQNHYQEIIDLAEQKRQELNPNAPLIAMGHLFAMGGETVEGDGVRDLYIGSLAHVGANIFSENVDYVALGHLHIPQKVAGCERIRYSGSPLAMGFNEAKQTKIVCEIEFSDTDRQARITDIPIPTFQKLAQIKGDWQTISRQISEWILLGESVWLEIIYQGDEVIGDLRERVQQLTEHSAVEVLRIKNHRITPTALSAYDAETLDDLDIYQVFQRCLESKNISENQQIELKQAYQEIARTLLEWEDDEKARC